jgi:hypothetical protein
MAAGELDEWERAEECGEAAAAGYCAGAEKGGNGAEEGGNMEEEGLGYMGCGKTDCEAAIAWARSSQAAAESRLQALIVAFEQQLSDEAARHGCVVGQLEEERAAEREGHRSSVREMEGIIKALQRKLEDTAGQLHAVSSEYSAAAAQLKSTAAALACLEAEHSELLVRVQCLEDSRKHRAALESSTSSLQREHAAMSEDLRARMLQQANASVRAARVLAFMFAGMERSRLQNAFDDFVVKATSPAEKAVARASAHSSKIELRAAGIALHRVGVQRARVLRHDVG